MSRIISTLFLALVLAVPTAAFAQDYDAAGEQAMFERVNALRAENGLSALTRADELDHVARAHSVDMASRNQLAHVSPHTGTPEDRVNRAGITAGTISENVAMHRDTDHAQSALVASAPHRANMLSPDVTHVGIGSVRSSGNVFVTQLYVSRPAQAASEIPVPEVIPTPEPPAPVFELIPPFLEQAVTDPAGAVTDLPATAEAVTQAVIAAPVAAPQSAPEAPAAPTTALPAPPAATPDAAPAPTVTAPGTVAPAPTAPTAVSANDALRQLVDFANAFLNGGGSTY